jgi:peptide subunit release factor 1 (eRF1)
LVDVQTIYYVLEATAAIAVIGSAVWGALRWVNGHKQNLAGAKKSVARALSVDGSVKEQITCSECQTVFSPEWREREAYDGTLLQVATCPQCGEKNEFEVEEDDADEGREDA